VQSLSTISDSGPISQASSSVSKQDPQEVSKIAHRLVWEGYFEPFAKPSGKARFSDHPAYEKLLKLLTDPTTAIEAAACLSQILKEQLEGGTLDVAAEDQLLTPVQEATSCAAAACALLHAKVDTQGFGKSYILREWRAAASGNSRGGEIYLLKALGFLPDPDLMLVPPASFKILWADGAERTQWVTVAYDELALASSSSLADYLSASTAGSGNAYHRERIGFVIQRMRYNSGSKEVRCDILRRSLADLQGERLDWPAHEQLRWAIREIGTNSFTELRPDLESFHSVYTLHSKASPISQEMEDVIRALGDH
jgi:hypothetical protein